MNLKPNPYDFNIVLLGSFNPAIFNPEWFRKIGLFSDEEIDASYEADIALNEEKSFNYTNNPVHFISPSISIVKISELDIRVEPHRFQILTMDKCRNIMVPYFSLCH